MLWVHIILLQTPAYVWVCFVFVLFLGVHRLKTRRAHLATIAMPTFAFLSLSLVSASLLAERHMEAVTLAGGLSFLIGVWASRFRAAGQPIHMQGWWFERLGSRLPLAGYMILFVLHYALGIWAGFVPAQSSNIGIVRLLISAATAGWSMTGLAECWGKVRCQW